MLHTFRIVLIAASVALASTSSPAQTVHDAVAEWSDASNPNGVWTYASNGAAITQHLADWETTPGTGTFPGTQPVWAAQHWPDPNHIPAWLKVATAAPGFDLPIGSLAVHTDDAASGSGIHWATLAWTAPQAGTASISGDIWHGALTQDFGHRAIEWRLRVNSTDLVSGVLSLAAVQASSSSPVHLGHSDAPRSVAVAQGDTIALEARVHTSGTQLGIWFVTRDYRILLEPANVASTCPGDGFAVACPCANESEPGTWTGCKSSLGVGGMLRATGVPSIASDSLTLAGSAMPSSSALYFQGTTAIHTAFGDGLRCAGGSVVRLATTSNVAGASSYPTGTDPRISVQGMCFAGATRHYQCWYRNAASFCTAETFNLTNAVRVEWQS